MWIASAALPSLAIAVPWRRGLAVNLAGVGLLFFQIPPEERALSAKFGGQYDSYTQAVRRWL